MEYESNDNQITSLLTGMVLGAVLGAGIALLSAPDSGRRTRRRIKRKAGTLRDDAGDRWDELAEEVKAKVDDAIRTTAKKLPGR